MNSNQINCRSEVSLTKSPNYIQNDQKAGFSSKNSNNQIKARHSNNNLRIETNNFNKTIIANCRNEYNNRSKSRQKLIQINEKDNANSYTNVTTKEKSVSRTNFDNCGNMIGSVKTPRGTISFPVKKTITEKLDISTRKNASSLASNHNLNVITKSTQDENNIPIKTFNKKAKGKYEQKSYAFGSTLVADRVNGTPNAKSTKIFEQNRSSRVTPHKTINNSNKKSQKSITKSKYPKSPSGKLDFRRSPEEMNENHIRESDSSSLASSRQS